MSEMVPKFRFQGFTDDWEQRKWINTVDISKNMVDPRSGEYDELLHIGPGNIEPFTGRILDNVKTVKVDNLISGKFHFNPNDIIYGKINPQLAKYAHVNFEGLASADAYILNAKNGVSQNFLYVELQTSGFYRYSVSVSMRTGMPKINRDELNQFSYLAPKKIEEQNKIGLFFKQLDDLITLHQRKLDLLKEQKKGFLQKMFPKDGQLVPEVRFEGFADDWEQRKLGDLLKEFSIKSKIEDEHKVLSSTNSGMEFREGRVSGTSNLGYKIIKNGDLVLSPQNLWLGNININNIGKGLVSPSYKTFELINIDSSFINPQLRTKKMLEEYKNSSTQGASVVRRNLEMDSFYQIKIFVPTISEQEKIGSFFQQLDNTIVLHQRKLDSLKEQKKGFLQKMFVS